MSTPPLTIAIPTFQRVPKLLARVRELLPQLGANDQIIINDNASPDFLPVNHPELQDARVKVLINSANIGGNANIAKLFGLCSTRWMWLLSDDDPVKPHAIEVIRNEILAFPEACFISAQSVPTRTSSIECNGLGEFLALNRGFADTLLISNCIFNLDVIRPSLKFAHVAIHMNAPHLAPALKALESGASAVYSAGQVVEWGEPDAAESWSRASVYHLLSLPKILDNGDHAVALTRVIADGLPAPEKFVAQLSWMRVHHGDDWRIVPYGHEVITRYFAGRGPAAALRRLLLQCGLHFPRAFLSIFGVVYKVIKGRRLEDTLQDRKFSLYI